MDKSIGIVCSSKGYGGLEMNTLLLAHTLSLMGWNVRLLLNEESKMFAEAKLKVRDVASLQQYKMHARKATSDIIRGWLKETPVAVLFTPYNKDIAPLAFYKRFRNKQIKLVYQQHMKVGVNKKDIIHKFRYGAIDLWISPLEYLKQETTQRTNVPARKIAVIPFGLDVSRFMGSPLSKAEARIQLELPAPVFMIGVLGRIDPKKGQDFLIRALPYLHTHVSQDIDLMVMGNITPHEGDDYINKLYELVKKLGLENRVHFRGFNPDVMMFYKAIDVFAMPAHGETFGMVTIEAMAAGVPVIGVGRDGTKELLEAGRLGYLHGLEDKELFAEGVRSTMERGEAKEKAKLAQLEVAEKYSAGKMFAAIDKAVSALI